MGPGPNFDVTQCYDETNEVNVASCTPQTGSAANNWLTITCLAPNTAAPIAVQTCTPSAATAANNWVTTSCDYPAATNYTNRPQSSCIAQNPSASNQWVRVTCPTNNTGPTPVQSCTPASASSSNDWTATSCNTVTTSATVVDPATCPLGPGRASVTTPGSAPMWITVTCSAKDEAAVPVGTCTPVAATASNSWTQTVCPPPVVTTNVPVASCTERSATSSNNWTSTSCSPSVTTGPTPVQSCTPVLPTAANNFVATTCPTAITGPAGVQSCQPTEPSASNNWTTTTCETSVVTTPVASCQPVARSAANGWTTTTCPPKVTTAPTPVKDCTPQAATFGNNWTATICDTTSGPNNYTSRPVASCVPQTGASGNGWVDITCSSAVTTNVAVAACTPAPASVNNNYLTTDCVTTVTGPTAVPPGQCTPGAATATNQFTATTCDEVATGPTLVTSCVPSTPSNSNSFTRTTCKTDTADPELVSACTESSANPSNNFTTTTCQAVQGQKYQYQTIISKRERSYSGGQVASDSPLGSSTSDFTDLNSICYVAGLDPVPPPPNPGKPGTDWEYSTGKVMTLPPLPPAPCKAWPCRTITSLMAGGAVDTLADVAQYYYVTDLRPDMQDNVPPTGTGPEDDRATWQHMTTFTIGLGVSGELAYRSDYRNLSTTVGDFAAIRDGKKNWPIPAQNAPSSIDDFWHTAVNGRGLYFSAGSPTSVIQGLTGSLAGVTARSGAGSAAAPSSQKPSDGDNLTYIATYVTQKWAGDLEAREIDLAKGGPKPTQIWSAKAKLEAKVGNECDNRKIWLFRNGAPNNMTPFTWNTRACNDGGAPAGPSSTGLNAAERAFFDASRASLLSQYGDMTNGALATVDQRSDAAGANLLNFVRGQRGNEGFEANKANRLYRKRESVLGDIVNSQPAYVRRATSKYVDPGYADFIAKSDSRTPMIYVGSNGGMLHAFRAGTSTTDPDGGNEEWAFVPTQVLPNLYRLADANYAANHVYLVDGTPVPFDAYDSADAAWKKVLVAGLRAGGRGYYALDVTDPLSPKALWEFNWSATCYDGTAATSASDCHLGYSFGMPSYSKLKDGTWVVLVSSGYNNVNSPAKTGDGQGYLYVLNAFTGRIIYKISTEYGSAASPSGLGPLVTFTDDPTVDATALMVYGADLAGNVWRFDINNPDLDKRRASLVAVAKAPDGSRQPITAALNLLERDGLPYIQIGTGRLIGTTDIADDQVQSIYVFPDSSGAPITNLRSVLAPQVQKDTSSDPNQPSGKRTVSCQDPALCGNAMGWYSDLPSKGERVIVDPTIKLGTLGVATSIPTAEQCNVVGTGTFITVDAYTGNAIPGTNGLISQGFLPALPVGLTVLQLPGGGIVGVVADATGGHNALPFPVQPRGPVGKRVTWRELVQ
jgi:Tfp pilus tip-associated adhesin PilY1